MIIKNFFLIFSCSLNEIFKRSWNKYILRYLQDSKKRFSEISSLNLFFIKSSEDLWKIIVEDLSKIFKIFYKKVFRNFFKISFEKLHKIFKNLLKIFWRTRSREYLKWNSSWDLFRRKISKKVWPMSIVLNSSFLLFLLTTLELDKFFPIWRW